LARLGYNGVAMSEDRPHVRSSRPTSDAPRGVSRAALLRRTIYLKVLPVGGAAALMVGVAGSFDPARPTANWLIAAIVGVVLLVAASVIAVWPQVLRRVERVLVACAVAAFASALSAVTLASVDAPGAYVDGLVRIGLWTGAIAGFAHLALPPRAAALLSGGVWVLLAAASGAVLALTPAASVSDRTTVVESLLVQACVVVIIGGIVRVTRAERERASTMERIASLDMLTGLVNRRIGEDVVAKEVARARRHGHSLSVAWMDLDRFKRINDRYGHDVGDRVLSTVASAVLAAVRDHDTVARWGGEEFVVVLPGQNQREAKQAADRLRRVIARLDARLPDAERVTASFGVAELGPTETSTELVRRADQALYLAKGGGRDRVVPADAAGTPACC
jgi:diguanylate cyclase (GGDEF)-like protein